MEITFLGTGAGAPTKRRNVTAIALKKDHSKSWQLIDCGEGTQHQLFHTHLSLNCLEAIFITHLHGDHCYGLPGLLASAAMLDRRDPLTIVGPHDLQKYIEFIQKTTRLFCPYEINFVDIEHCNEPIINKAFDVETIELSHRVPSFAFHFTEKIKQHRLNVDKLIQEGINPGSVWNRLQKGEDVVTEDNQQLKSDDYLLEGKKPGRVIIAGDNDKPELLLSRVEGVNVLVHEATFTEEISVKIGNKPQHSSAKTVAKFATDTAISNLILTHFSSRYNESSKSGLLMTDILEEAKAFYSGNLYLANDFDTFHLNQDGELTIRL